jgi:hypothetical protein
MATSTEKLALRLMKDLEKEWQRDPQLLTCQCVREIAPWLWKSPDQDRVFKFLFEQHFVLGVKRGSDFAMLPNAEGIAWIASQRTSKTTLERVALIVGIILGFATFAWGVFVWLRPNI